MTDLLLAVVVISAVIAFGALISVGNERQRRAIDVLHLAYKQWAMQDLRIKRERLARDVHINDPLGWFNKLAAKTCGRDLKLQVVEIFENPHAVICIHGDGGGKVIFTLLSPAEIHSMKRAKHNRLSRYDESNPLLSLPRRVNAFECSVLNNGILFDLELPLAWKGLTGHSIDEIGFMWMFMLS